MRIISKTPTVSITPAYTAGDNIGGKIALGNQRGFKLQSLTITDKSNQGPTGSILFFDGEPTTATLTDNAAGVLPAADLAKVLAIFTIPAYTTIDSKKIATLANIDLPLKNGDIYAAIVTTGTPTLTAADALVVKFGFLPVN